MQVSSLRWEKIHENLGTGDTAWLEVELEDFDEIVQEVAVPQKPACIAAMVTRRVK